MTAAGELQLLENGRTSLCWDPMF